MTKILCVFLFCSCVFAQEPCTSPATKFPCNPVDSTIELAPDHLWPLVSQLTLSKNGTTLTGSQSSTVVVNKSSNMANCNGSGDSAVCITADRAWMGGFSIDGNKAQNNQDIYGLMVNGNNARILDMNVMNVQGSKAYGGAISVRDVQRPFLTNVVLRENNSDGLDVFGSTSHGIFTGISSNHNGMLGVEVERSGLKRPTLLLFSNIMSTRNGAANFQVQGADDVVANGILTESGGVGHDSNNSNARIRSSDRVLLSSFVFRGPANGGPQGAWFPAGLSFDHEGKAEQNKDIVAIGGVISGYTSSGISVSRSDAAVGSGTNGLTLIGINSTGNGGYGADFGNIKSNDNNVVFLGNQMSGNQAGDVNKILSVPTHAILGNLPFSKTLPPIHLQLAGALLMGLDNEGNATFGKNVSAQSLIVNSNAMRPSPVPVHSTVVCTQGDFADDSQFHYYCSGNGAWKRVAWANDTW
jgi:hypothetical protein